MEYPIIEHAPDYIVATVLREEGRWQEVQNNWLDIIHQERIESGLVEDSGMLGYVGLLAGAAFWGTRPDGSILRLTGSGAARNWGLWCRATGKPTRIDLQVTVRAGDEWVREMQRIREGAEAASLALPETRRRKVRVISDNAYGQTVYIGSRSSKALGRLYHKWAVNKDQYLYGDLRYEVQLNGEHAALAYESWVQSGLDIIDYARGYVYDWFSRRGASPAFRLDEAVNSRFTDVLEPNPLASKLDWLYNQVGPTARLLSEQGHTAEVFRVLFGPQWLEIVLGRLSEEGEAGNGS